MRYIKLIQNGQIICDSQEFMGGQESTTDLQILFGSGCYLQLKEEQGAFYFHLGATHHGIETSNSFDLEVFLDALSRNEDLLERFKIKANHRGPDFR